MNNQKKKNSYYDKFKLNQNKYTKKILIKKKAFKNNKTYNN